MDKKAYFFIDDTIWVMRDLTRLRPASMFDNDFLKALKKAHDDTGLTVQLNLFYRTDFFYGSDEFTLADMTDAYKAEFEALYTITFVSEDGNTELWKKQDYKYNDKVEYGGTLPTKAPDATHYYEFTGWVDTKDTKKTPTVYANDQLPNVTESVTYKAHFKAGTPVELVATYTGEPLTKVYDCNNRVVGF